MSRIITIDISQCVLICISIAKLSQAPATAGLSLALFSTFLTHPPPDRESLSRQARELKFGTDTD